MKNIRLTLFFLFIINVGFSIKPTEIKLSNSGHIINMYFNLEESASFLMPLSAINVSGELINTSMQLKINNSYFWFDQYGNTLTDIRQTDLKIYFNLENKIEKIKNLDNVILYKFYYDFNGRLAYVKDGSYVMKFRLYYDFDGHLSQIADGNYNKHIKFYSDFEGRVSGIKDKSYNYEYKFTYDFSNRLEKIKDKNYIVLAKITYSENKIQHISKSNLGCRISIENQCNQLLYSNGLSNELVLSNNVITIYSNFKFSGGNKSFPLGNYSSLGYEWNDKISSIALPDNVKIIVYENESFSGDSAVITSNWTSISYSDLWNNKISSFQIMLK